MDQNLKILLIEDDADDIELLEEALHNNDVKYKIDIIMEGDKVLPYLKTCHQLPQVIIMDLNLPKMHGREILKQMNTSGFNNIPLIVLTTSTTKTDSDYSQKYGADHFLTKPTTIEGFNSTVALIVQSAMMGKKNMN